MSTDPTLRAADSPVIDDETDAVYSIEVVAELAGVDAGTVLRYQEQGFLRPAGAAAFDAGSLRQLRRIEHLRATCGVNDAGLKLILSLLEEVESLREAQRRKNL